MKNVRKTGRVDSKTKNVLGSIKDKMLYFRKKEFFENIHCCHSDLISVPSDNAKH